MLKMLRLLACFAFVVASCGDDTVGGSGGTSGSGGMAGSGGTGGSGGSGGTGGMTIDAPIDGASLVDAGACATCAATHCATQLAACQADTACNCTFTCFAGGGNEGTCRQQCNSQNNTAWMNLIDCIDNMCQNDC